MESGGGTRRGVTSRHVKTSTASSDTGAYLDHISLLSAATFSCKDATRDTSRDTRRTGVRVSLATPCASIRSATQLRIAHWPGISLDATCTGGHSVTATTGFVVPIASPGRGGRPSSPWGPVGLLPCSGTRRTRLFPSTPLPARQTAVKWPWRGRKLVARAAVGSVYCDAFATGYTQPCLP